ncbi:MAG: hypothetical protein RIQ77_66 [Pseudomonadota bacterium]
MRSAMPSVWTIPSASPIPVALIPTTRSCPTTAPPTRVSPEPMWPHSSRSGVRPERSAPSPVGHLAGGVDQLRLGGGGGHVPIEQAFLAIGLHFIGAVSVVHRKGHTALGDRLHGAVIELPIGIGHHDHGLAAFDGPVDRIVQDGGGGEGGDTPDHRLADPPAPRR